MRSDPATFAAQNQAAAKSPRYVIAHVFDVASVYCTSHAGIASVPGVVIENVLEDISAVSQRIVPDEGRSEIGTLSYRIVDLNSAFTLEAQDKLLNDDKSFRGKLVRLYVGYEGMDFTDFQIFTTQVVKDMSFDDGVYSISCQDITREQRVDVFEPKKTTLRDSVDATVATIPVYDTTGFRTVGHGPSYSDGPNAAVGFFRLEDEVIRYTGKTSDTFTGCTRGVLNTKAIAHTVDAGADADRRPKIDEVIYLELPAPKLARAILTGAISPNFVPNGSFETDGNADGLSDGWAQFVGGAGDGGRTHSLTRPASLTGSGVCQRVEITGGVGNTNDTGLDITTSGGLTRIACGSGTLLPEGTSYFLSAYVRTNVAAKVTIRVRNLPGTIDDVSSAHPGGSAWVLLTKAGTVRSGQTTLDVQIRGITLAGEWFEVDDVQLEIATARSDYAEGPIAGRSNELPSHWHCGIDQLLVRTQDFVAIGPDIWDTRLDTNGVVLRFDGLTKTSAKKFLESELYMLMGCYSPIYSDGTIGLKRMNQVLADAAFVMELNESNVVSAGTLLHDFSGMHNSLSIDWNWNGKEFTRDNAFIDATSVQIHGESDLTELSFKGLHGSRHTAATIMKRLDAYRDRYAAPPERITVSVMPSIDRLEVGDVVRLKLPNVRDFAGPTVSINRSFEIQRKSQTHQSGDVDLDLFGSTAPASTDPPNTATEALPDAYYTAVGTELSTVVTISVIGGVGVIQAGSYNLTGHADMNNAAAVYYYDGDLELANGATLTVNDNVQIRAKGFFQVNGTIDGVGRGNAGVAGSSTWNVLPAGTQGFIGNSRGMDGVIAARTVVRVREAQPSTHPCAMTQGRNSSFPQIDLTVSGNSLLGVPTDMRGTSGGPGGKTGHYAFNAPNSGTVTANGGTGGDSGAGLAIISRGLAFGASGLIDLSGDDSAATSPLKGIDLDFNVYPGAGGAGCPGALLILLDGSGHSLPDIGGKFIAACGDVPVNGTPLPERGPISHTQMKSRGWTQPGAGFLDASMISGVDLSNVAYRIQYIPGVETPQIDQDIKPPAPTALSLVPGERIVTAHATLGGPLLEHDFVEIWASIDNQRANATRVGNAPVTEFTVDLPSGTGKRWFWERVRRQRNGPDIFSDWFPTGATSGLEATPLDFRGEQPGSTGVFLDTFEHQDYERFYNLRAGTPTITYPTDGDNGGRVIEIEDYGWLAWRQNIPYDPTATYRITVRARMTAAPTNAQPFFFAGVEGVAEDGTTLISTAGTNTHNNAHYVAASNFNFNSVALDDWQTFHGYLRGLDATPSPLPAPDIADPAEMYASGGTVVKFIRPMLIANYNGGDGTMQVDYFRIDRVVGTGGLEPDAATDPAVTDEPADGSQAYSAVTQPQIEASGIGGLASYTSPADRATEVKVSWAVQVRISNLTSGVAVGVSRVRVAVSINGSLAWESIMVIEGYTATDDWATFSGTRDFTVPAGQDIDVNLNTGRAFSTGGASPAQTHFWQNALVNVKAAKA